MSEPTPPAIDILGIIQENGNMIRYVPHELQTLELCISAMQRGSYIFNLISPKFHTREICMMISDDDLYQMEQYPMLHLVTVQRNWRNLRHVEDKHKNDELCTLAVQQDIRALEYVSLNYLTPEVCLNAVRQDGCIIRILPEKVKTPELYLAAVQQNGLAIDYISNPTTEICLAAVQQNGLALEFIPSKYFNGSMDIPNDTVLTVDVCLAAVRQNGLALEFITSRPPRSVFSKYQTPEIYMAAFLQNHQSLKYISSTQTITQSGVRYTFNPKSVLIEFVD